MTKRIKTFHESDLKYVAAPLVNQSDLPWRMLVAKYGTTATYTQMYLAKDINKDPALLESIRKDLSLGRDAPENQRTTSLSPIKTVLERSQDVSVGEDYSVFTHKPQIVQLAGDDAAELLKASQALIGYADGVDLNLGCPQRRAREGHYGAYLLGKKDWELLHEIVTLLTDSLPIPVSVKIRLCSPIPDTIQLARFLSKCTGLSHITLHSRFTSETNRRKGPAKLEVVKHLVERFREEGLIEEGVKILSNGNVRSYEDVQSNLDYTKAHGVMSGERLLEDACLFLPSLSTDLSPSPSPLDQSLEYLNLVISPHLSNHTPNFASTPSVQHIYQHLKTMLLSSALYPPSKERGDLIRRLEEVGRGEGDRLKITQSFQGLLTTEKEKWERWKSAKAVEKSSLGL